MLAIPSLRLGAITDCSEEFLEELKAYDPVLDAIRDLDADSIYVWAVRRGLKIHELTAHRSFGENWPELERRTLAKLRECDVWKRFGSGKAYDDYLDEKEKKHRETMKVRNKSEQLAKLKEDSWAFAAAIWNAQHGRLTRDEVLPFKIPTSSSVKGNGKAERIV